MSYIAFVVFIATLIAVSMIAWPAFRMMRRWKRRRYLKRRLSVMALDRLRFERQGPDLVGDTLLDEIREKFEGKPARRRA